LSNEKKKDKIWSWAPKGSPIPRRTVTRLSATRPTATPMRREAARCYGTHPRCAMRPPAVTGPAVDTNAFRQSPLLISTGDWFANHRAANESCGAPLARAQGSEALGVLLQLYTSSLHSGQWSASRPGRFISRVGNQAADTHPRDGWIGPRAGLLSLPVIETRFLDRSRHSLSLYRLSHRRNFEASRHVHCTVLLYCRTV
jgi:hypothetical protein